MFDKLKFRSEQVVISGEAFLIKELSIADREKLEDAVTKGEHSMRSCYLAFCLFNDDGTPINTDPLFFENLPAQPFEKALNKILELNWPEALETVKKD